MDEVYQLQKISGKGMGLMKKVHPILTKGIKGVLVTPSAAE